MGEKLSKVKLIQDPDAEAYVLGSIINDPNILHENKFDMSYFSMPFTQIIYSVCNNMFENGVAKIEPSDVYLFLDKFPPQKKIFEDNDGLAFLNKILEDTGTNFTYHYERIKKAAYLRDLTSNGVDVSRYYDSKDIEPKSCAERHTRYLTSSLGEIMDYYQGIFTNINSKYSTTETKIVKAGSRTKFKQLLEMWQAGGSWGLPFQSKYLTATTRGMKKKNFYIVSAGSGCGKTRTAISIMVNHFAVEIFNSETKTWETNLTATTQKGGGLYLQYEMDIDEELMPIIVANIAAIPQDLILEGNYSQEIADRIAYAMDVLDRSNIWLGEIPEFTVREIDNTVGKYVLTYGVSSVYFDYIDQSPSLTKEYIESAKSGTGIRDDLVLKNFSKKLKSIGKKWKVSMYTSTQITGDTNDSDNHGYNLIANSKAIVNSADFHSLLLRVTDKERQKLEPIMERIKCIEPTHSYVVCKNRGSKYVNIRIFLHIDFDTMRVTDLFCTDMSYELLPDVPRVAITYDSSGASATIDGSSLSFEKIADDIKSNKSTTKKTNKEEKTGFGKKPR